jgi:hypothetical protein
MLREGDPLEDCPLEQDDTCQGPEFQMLDEDASFHHTALAWRTDKRNTLEYSGPVPAWALVLWRSYSDGDEKPSAVGWCAYLADGGVWLTAEEAWEVISGEDVLFRDKTKSSGDGGPDNPGFWPSAVIEWSHGYTCTEFRDPLTLGWQQIFG